MFQNLQLHFFLADGEGGGRVQLPRHLDVTAQTLQIGQMVMSLLHSWGLDTSLDHICEHTLGLLKPRVPVSYGLISKSGEPLHHKTIKLPMLYILLS